ncbi:hypothetical protein NZ45_07975 [Clostridium botulinum]|uniref:Lipoprotein n=1 Tax=Clostridium botulinum TaxID=1491 RepID=A0ABD7CG25_CLOBO|nr:hypothetical protein [Clostridium botulinum]KGO14289.1 hypothetical protein NZ45_07975 [Clostridium botulinum]QRI52257.1 hypothetical protein JQS73_12545 [Clostridium botulinum]
MKKLLITISLVLILISLIGCENKNENKNNTTETKTVSQQKEDEKNKEIEESKQEVVEDNKKSENSEDKSKPIEQKKDPKSEIETSINDIFNNGDYTNAKLNSITVNENLGTDISNDYIALVYLKFDIKNSRKTANEVMKMYSDDLVAKLASCSEISEIAVFWEDEYNNRTVKYAYKHKNDGFYIMDIAGE